MMQKLQLDRFDQIVLIVIMGLITLIGLVVLAGNNVGVQIESYAPETSARGDTAIRIRFYEDMEKASVEERFSISPDIEGSLRWNGDREIVFEPAEQFVSGTDYTVQLAQGAIAAASNAELKEAFSFSFEVAQPRIVYIAPATAADRNLMAMDLSTQTATQLTFSEYGLADYAISTDGRMVAYSQYNEDGTSDIWMLEVASGATRQLTNCVNSACFAPNWKPDGTQIAYEREEYDEVFGQVSARRVWIVDVATARSTLLFDDTQIVGHSPQFAPNGNKIAMFSTNPPAIMIYDYIAENRVMIESMQGVVGEFSPDSQKLVYPVLVRGAVGESFYTHLELVDLSQNERIRMTAPEAPVEDRMATWNPDGVTLAVARRYFDGRGTPGTQIYLVNTETSEEIQLTNDPNYTHGALRWSADGKFLLMQRFNQMAQGSKPEIWLYTLETGELTMIAEDVFLPGFLP